MKLKLIEPENFHQRTPLILGSKENVQKFIDTKSSRKKISTTNKLLFPWDKLSISKMRFESKKTVNEFSKE